MRIGFIRHGITSWNEEGRIQGGIDIPLNDKGIWMARQLAKRLQFEQWEVLYTSPSQRALETAKMIASVQEGISFHIEERVKEIGEGKLEGTTEQDRLLAWGENWQRLALGREPIQLVHQRADSFLQELDKMGVGSVLVVSHGSFIYELLQMLNVIPRTAVELLNGSLTIIEYGPKQQEILYNCIEHLR